jgi:hypothetical protein
MSEILDADIAAPDLDVPVAAAWTIAAGMREVSHSDGAHPREDAVIDEFERGLPPGEPVVVLESLDTVELRAAFVQSLVLVAYADGAVSDAERTLVRQYAFQLGFDEKSLAAVWSDVAVDLLSTFNGVRVYRDAIAAIGEKMGLDAGSIDRALGS